MFLPRLIPVLLLSGTSLVKTRSFEAARYVGDPINAVKIFNDKEVDELILLDVSATRLGVEPDFAFLEEVAGEASMPLSYGGGISSVSLAERIFSIGFEKVSVNSALSDISLVREFSRVFGSQAIIASVDIKRRDDGRQGVWSYSADGFLAVQLENHLREPETAGVGEFVLTDVDREGTRSGLNLEAIEQVSKIVTVPLVVNGGVGSLQDVVLGWSSGADSVGAGAFFIYHGPHDAVLLSYPDRRTLEKLVSS